MFSKIVSLIFYVSAILSFCNFVGMLVRLRKIHKIMMRYTTGHLFSRSDFSLSIPQSLSLSYLCLALFDILISVIKEVNLTTFFQFEAI